MPVAEAQTFGGQVPARPPPACLFPTRNLDDLEYQGRKGKERRKEKAQVTEEHIVTFTLERGNITA